MSDGVDVLAYYYPQWHQDPVNDRLHRPGWTEWELLETSAARFDGHLPPGRPAAGPADESDPEVAAAKVDAAAGAGLTGFVVDWYWYQDGPFLNGFLDRGLLPALSQRTGQDFRFALMWANHPWLELFPAADSRPRTLLEGPRSRYEFDAATDHVIANYLTHPAYWRIDGRPYFSLYDLPTLIACLGGTGAARQALDRFRRRSAAAGAEVHLNLCANFSTPDVPGLLDRLGADSTTHYTWMHHEDSGLDVYPASPYRRLAERAAKVWRTAPETLRTPYLPNVTVGWDPTPRCGGAWPRPDDREYPYTPVIGERSPDQLAAALADAVALAPGLGPSAVTINAWNEWTEGSYLEADEHGTPYLDAVRDVLTAARRRP